MRQEASHQTPKSLSTHDTAVGPLNSTSQQKSRQGRCITIQYWPNY